MTKKFTEEVNFKLDFRRNTHKGLYIALEGIDGSGKTVQSSMIAEYFQDKKKVVLPVAEPRRTGPIGEVINDFLQKRIVLPPASHQFLFVADRIAHQEDIVIPALKNGEIVISHRNFWSAVAYGILDKQTTAKVKGESDVLMVAQSILSMYHQIMVPDITFYLKVSPKVAIKRLKRTGVETEYYETESRLSKVMESYEWLVKRFSSEFSIIDGDQDIERVTEDILSVLHHIKK